MLALFADSTNVDRRGVTGSETDVVDAFDELFASTEGKLVVAAFASSVYRMQIIVDLAAKFDRRVAFVGRGMQENSQIAQRLGYLRVPTGIGIKDADVASFPAGDVVCLVTGSQGEPKAALSRIAIDDHRHVSLAPGDTVVLSARAIPGNEKPIGRVVNHLARRQVDVVTEESRHVHVSGHGSLERAEAGAVAGAAAIPRAGPRRVPPAVAPRAGRPSWSPAACPRRRGCCWPRTATGCGSTPRAAACSTPCPPGAC